MRILGSYFAVLALAFPAASYAEPIRLTGYYLGSNADSSRLNLECSGESASEIECKIQQLVFSQPKPDKIEQSRKDGYAGFAEMKAKRFDCPKPDEGLEAVDQSKLSEDQRAGLAVYRRLCKEQSEEAWRALIDFDADKAMQTCRVAVYDPSPVRLYKIGENAWANRPQPSEVCGAMTSMILERQPGSNHLLTWKQVRTYANRSEEVCKGLEIDKPVVWTWKHGDTVRADCKFIKFSLF